MAQDKCPECGSTELVVLKRERMPSGKTKLIQKCKKCGKFLETIVSQK